MATWPLSFESNASFLLSPLSVEYEVIKQFVLFLRVSKNIFFSMCVVFLLTLVLLRQWPIWHAMSGGENWLTTYLLNLT